MTADPKPEKSPMTDHAAYGETLYGTAAKQTLFPFEAALSAVKKGAKISRSGWNGKGMWVRLVDLYGDKQFAVTEKPGSEGTWLPLLAMKTANGKLVPWLASQTDLLAADWEIAFDR